MREARALAYVLPLLAVLTMAVLGIADWSLWGTRPRQAAPLFWQGVDWLLSPFVVAGLPLLAPTTWIWSWLSPFLSRLFGPGSAQNGAYFALTSGLLFALYLAVRGRSLASGVIMRASLAGSFALILFGLLSALAIKGSGDGQAAISLVMGQNGGLAAAVLVAEWILRRSGQPEAP